MGGTASQTCRLVGHRKEVSGCARQCFTCEISHYCYLVLQTGQLNEYTERKEMQADVICMALGRVPTGEQRCRFLAVGLADTTVRIISLDPSVSTSVQYPRLDPTDLDPHL